MSVSIRKSTARIKDGKNKSMHDLSKSLVENNYLIKKEIVERNMTGQCFLLQHVQVLKSWSVSENTPRLQAGYLTFLFKEFFGPITITSEL